MFPTPALVQAALIFLSSATAVSVFGFRLGDLSIIMFGLSLVVYRPREVGGLLSLSAFLLVVVFTIVLSTGYSGLVDAQKLEDGMANAVAVPLAVLVSLACVWLMDSERVLHIAAKYTRVALAVCLLVFFWQLFLGTPEWFAYEEGIDRFSALSRNPNQLALYLLPVPFFSLFAYLRGLKGRWAVGGEVALVVAINFFMLGKALFIGWGVSVAFLFILGGVWFGGVRLNGLWFYGRVLLTAVSFGLVMPIMFALYRGDTAGSQADQGDIRLRLWEHAFDAWTDSVIVGHGPGHYSGLEASFQNTEAHNFLIDWLSAYGLLGGMALVAYLAWLVACSFRQRAWIVLALYLTLFVQATFHFYGRQPLFWMLLVFGHFISSSSINRQGDHG